VGGSGIACNIWHAAGPWPPFAGAGGKPLAPQNCQDGSWRNRLENSASGGHQPPLVDRFVSHRFRFERTRWKHEIGATAGKLTCGLEAGKSRNVCWRPFRERRPLEPGASPGGNQVL